MLLSVGGILNIALGLAILILPQFLGRQTLAGTIETLMAVFLISTGIIQAIHFAAGGDKDLRSFEIVHSMVTLLAGITILVAAPDGNLTCTTIVATYFGISAALLFGAAVRVRGKYYFPHILAHGLLAVVLSVMIWVVASGFSGRMIASLIAVHFVARGIVNFMCAERALIEAAEVATASGAAAAPATSGAEPATG